ncbi:MAG: glycosyltransferase family 4 protein [Candidatus Peribacteraceae bacterium]
MPIRSLMFGWEYPPLHLGGLGVACQGLVKGLMRNGVHVTLVLPQASTTEDTTVIFPTQQCMNTVRVQSFLSPYEGTEHYEQRIKTLPAEIRHMYGSDLPQAVMHFAEMSVEMTKDVPTDVVHCHDWMTYGAGIRAANHHNRPLVTHIHATELDRTHFHPNQWIYDIERLGFEKADTIIAVSNYTKNILVQHYGITPDKIRVVHNGMSVERMEYDDTLRVQSGTLKRPMVLFLGRLTIQKGPIQFLDMAAQVHAIKPDVTFVVAGDGNMMGEVIEHACVLGLQDCTLFTGQVNSVEAQHLYAQADCFVMPSLSEPFGLVALEAIAQGTPVVLSNQSGVSEVVRHGFNVDFWDTERMADCVLTILRDAPLAEQLQLQAPRSLQHLTWVNQGEHVRSIYENLLHNPIYT